MTDQGWPEGETVGQIIDRVNRERLLKPLEAERDRLLAKVERLREDLGVVIYHAENLQRYINHVPVRDLSESKMAFANVKRGLALDEQHVCPSSGDPCPCTPGSTSEAYCRAEVATAGQEQSG